MKKTWLLMIFLMIAIMFTSMPIKAEGSLVKVLVNGKPILPSNIT